MRPIHELAIHVLRRLQHVRNGEEARLMLMAAVPEVEYDAYFSSCLTKSGDYIVGIQSSTVTFIHGDDESTGTMTCCYYNEISEYLREHCRED